jgi:hypothetical protein
MDEKQLVKNIQKVLNSFQEESKTFDFVSIEPAYQGFHDSFILNLRADWLDELPCHESLQIITDRIFQLLDSNTIKHINSIHLLDRASELPCFHELSQNEIQIIPAMELSK